MDRNAAGCEATENITISNAPSAPSVHPVNAHPSCELATGTITVTTPTTDLTFKLDGGAFGPYPSGGWSSVSAGAHTVTVRNAAGCEATENITISNAPSAPSVTLAKVDPTCVLATGTITVTTPTTDLTFKLDGGAFGPYPSGGWSSVSAGAHTVTVRNAAGCEATENITISNAPSAPSVTLAKVDPTCVLATGTITVTTPTTDLTFKLDGGAFGPYPSGGWSSVSAGAHTVTVRNAAGCEATENITISNAPSAPSVTLAKVDPTCVLATGTITVTTPTTDLTFKLDGGAFGPYPSGGWSSVSAGAHTVTVRNAAGCEATENITISNAPSAPSVTLAKVDPTCVLATGTITVTTPTTDLTFKLDGGAFGSYPSGGWSSVSAGAHTVTVRNAAGCEATENITISNAPSAPSVTLAKV